MTTSRFDRLVNEALQQDFSGWDFSWARGRWHEEEPSWNYRQLAQNRIWHAESLLDMGTGGGEFLASLADLPFPTFATESYPPNIEIARDRLEPLGIEVIALESDQEIPLPDRSLELIINRHESYYAPELYRLLQPGGIFLTQQVGVLDNIRINQFLEAPLEVDAGTWNLDQEVQRLEAMDMRVTRAAEEFLDSVFDDIGVIVFYLKIISWQIPAFSVEEYRDRLLALHRHIEEQGPFVSKAHRLLIEAEKR